MLDTLILVVEIGDPKLQKIIAKSSFDNWSPSLRGAFVPPFSRISGNSAKYYLNTTKQDKELGIYTPRLTLYVQRVSGEYRRLLYIEFSAPKLIYGNNFTEVGISDYSKLCDALSESLVKKGVYLSPNQLRYAEVKAIHYSKNIIFTDGTRPTDVISYLSKTEVSLHKRTCETKYMNGGEALHIYTNSRGLCVYDKLKELEKARKTERGNLERDSWCQQAYVNKFLATAPKPFEVLRIESRLLNREVIVKTLHDLGMDVPNRPRLKDLYNPNIAKAILLSDLIKLQLAMPPSVGSREPPDECECLAEVQRLNPNTTLGNKVLLFGNRIIADKIGINVARKILKCTSRQWYDFKKRINGYNLSASKVNYFTEMRRQINQFKPLNLDDYRGKVV